MTLLSRYIPCQTPACRKKRLPICIGRRFLLPKIPSRAREPYLTCDPVYEEEENPLAGAGAIKNFLSGQKIRYRVLFTAALCGQRKIRA